MSDSVRVPIAAGPSRTPIAAGPPRTPIAAGPPRTPIAAGPSRTPIAAGPPPNPYFAIRVKVTSGQSLRDVGLAFGYANPGPILAYNYQVLNARKRNVGERQRSAVGQSFANSGLPADGTWAAAPLASNQIVDAASAGGTPQLWGPVVEVVNNYPINKPLPLDQMLYIPMHPAALDNLIRKLDDARVNVLIYARQQLDINEGNLNEIKKTFFVCDVLAALMTGFVELGFLSTAHEAEFAAETTQLVLIRAAHLATIIIHVAAEAKINDDDVFAEPSKGFWAILSQYNPVQLVEPSTYTPYLAALVNWDWDLHVSPEETAERVRKEIVDYARAEIDKIDPLLDLAHKARSASFYQHLVKDGPLPN